MSIIAITLATRNWLKKKKIDTGGAYYDNDSQGYISTDFLYGAIEAAEQTILQSIETFSEKEMLWRPYPETPSTGFLIWHVARVQDVLVHKYILEQPEIWSSQGWAQQFGLPLDETGQDYTGEQISHFEEPPKSELVEYLQATFRAALRSIEQLGADQNNLSNEKMMRSMRYLIILNTHVNLHAGSINYIREVLTASRETPEVPYEAS